jgi:hypothetical protein
MFGPLKGALPGQRFATDEKECGAHMALITTKIFFADGIRKFMNRYTICVEKRGDYIAK